MLLFQWRNNLKKNFCKMMLSNFELKSFENKLKYMYQKFKLCPMAKT